MRWCSGLRCPPFTSSSVCYSSPCSPTLASCTLFCFLSTALSQPRFVLFPKRSPNFYNHNLASLALPSSVICLIKSTLSYLTPSLTQPFTLHCVHQVFTTLLAITDQLPLPPAPQPAILKLFLYFFSLNFLSYT